MWVVPYGITVVVIGLVFSKFVRELPKNTWARFVAAGMIYLTGVLGIEMLGAREADLHDTTTVLYSMLYMLEELIVLLVSVSSQLLRLG